jgi:hypothetical protein
MEAQFSNGRQSLFCRATEKHMISPPVYPSWTEAQTEQFEVGFIRNLGMNCDTLV